MLNIKKYSIVAAIFLVISTANVGCDGGKVENPKNIYSTLQDIPAPIWEKLAQKKIYFGHQSVGYNLIDGVKDLMNKNPNIKLNIVETFSIADFRSGGLAHSTIGKNKNRKSKLDAFAEVMDKGLGNNVDTAFFKFCFVDIDIETDAQQAFLEYKSAMDRLKKMYPKTSFLHVTVPLQTSKTTLRTWIKKLIGKKNIWEYDRNISKNEYNKLLVDHYPADQVFDIALAESTYPDGKHSTFKKEGKTYYALHHEYSDDGGHLNDFGQKIVAEKFLLFLVNSL